MGRVDWSVLHALNNFMFQHDGVEDPLLFYVNASEALFIATLAVVFLAARGRFSDWRRACLAAVLSAGLGLGVGKLGVHYPSDILAGAVLGSAAALTLWVPPLRERIDRLADWIGGYVDRALDWGADSLATLRR